MRTGIGGIRLFPRNSSRRVREAAGGGAVGEVLLCALLLAPALPDSRSLAHARDVATGNHAPYATHALQPESFP